MNAEILEEHFASSGTRNAIPGHRVASCEDVSFSPLANPHRAEAAPNPPTRNSAYF